MFAFAEQLHCFYIHSRDGGRDDSRIFLKNLKLRPAESANVGRSGLFHEKWGGSRVAVNYFRKMRETKSWNPKHAKYGGILATCKVDIQL
jgi:hypothetical protein